MTVAPPVDPPTRIRPTRLPLFAWRPLLAVSGALAALEIAVSGRYGYHRDELYFVQAGEHLAWGYPDQPPLAPVVARLVGVLAPHSLVGLRILPALAAAAVVLFTGLIARELGGGRASQLLAAACMAVSAVLLLVGHTFGTTIIDLFAWTAICAVAARVLRGGDPRWWLVLGGIVGLALLNKTLVAALPLALLVGVLIGGPRHVLRTLWFPVGVVLAVLIVAPNLWWQATNGWPQLTLSAAIAAGGSGTSESRGMLPVLLAAGAPTVVGLLRRRGRTTRRFVVTAALGLSLLINCLLMLPLVPVDYLADTPIVDINYDAGETVGWPEFAGVVAGVLNSLPATERAGAVVLTGNYGEASAIDRYGPALGLPAAYSGHNAFWEWGPPVGGRPDDRSEVVVAVGISRDLLAGNFGSVEAAGTIDNGVGLDNEEQGRTVWLCRDQSAPWPQIWPSFRHLG